MLGKIFITGIGIISTVGRNAEEVLYSLRNAWSGGVLKNPLFRIAL
jgi:protein involved in polysaccharide export with SLBB domain